MGIFLKKLTNSLAVAIDSFIQAVVLIFLGTILVNGVLAHVYGALK